MTLHLDVERLALLGWRLYPASARSRAGCIRDGSTLATADLDQLARWATDFPGCSWRVIMGGSGIWGIDIDVPSADHSADGVAAMADLVRANGELPAGPRTRSGGGGMALIFKHLGEPIFGKTGYPAPGLDPRRGKLSITVPPSVHVTTGRPYRWLVAPWEITPPIAPRWLLNAVAPPPRPPSPPVRPSYPEPGSDGARRYAIAALRNGVERVAVAPQGQRNETLNREAFGLARFIIEGSLAAAEVAEALAHAARVAGLDLREIEATLASALRARAAR